MLAGFTGFMDTNMSKVPDNSDLLRQLMDNMTDNIFFKDRDHKFIMVNKANATWFGFEEPQEAIGMDDFDLFDAEFAQSALEDEKRVMETGEPMLGDEEQTVRDGMVVWGSVTKIPLRDKDGNIIGCIGIGRDITDLKRKEFELEDANNKLNQASEQIAEDLCMAAKLQKTFLPQTYPSFTSNDGKELLDFH
jgi:PAS domain S-box-containing protein